MIIKIIPTFTILSYYNKLKTALTIICQIIVGPMFKAYLANVKTVVFCATKIVMKKIYLLKS